MTREEAILEQARADMRDHLRDFCKHGPAYLEEYVGALLRDATTTWKARELRAHIHPKLAEFLRELALDAAVMERRTCGAAAPTPSPIANGQGTVVSRKARSSRRKVAA